MLRIGIVGAGGMGAVHYNNYAYIEECKVVALVGIGEQDKKRAREWDIPLYASVSELIKSIEIDVIDICTPTFLHKTNVMEGLEHGKHVIVEKPIALSKTDAIEMLEVAKKKKCLLYVAQVLQFTKEVETLKKLVVDETYGKPMDAYFERLSAAPEWAQGGWLFDKEKSGLLPYDLHIHDLDVIVSMFGKPEKIQIIENKRKEADYVEHYRIMYRYEGVNVVAEAAWFHASIPFSAKWRVSFENAVLIYDGNSLIAYPYNQEPVEYNIQDEIKVPTGINVPPTGWYLNELKHFVSCIQNNKKSNIIKDEQIITVLEILEEISSR